MRVKALELRDEGTFIPLIAVDMNPDNEEQRYLLRRCGYPCNGKPNVVVTRMSADGLPSSNDPYHWQDRTFAVGHQWIIEHWAELSDGDVVDVQFILGETRKPKVSEAKEAPF